MMNYKTILPWLSISGIAVIILFCIIAVARGCFSLSKQTQKTYVIAFPTRWQNIPLYGSEQNVTGFSSDLVYEIAKQMELKIQLISADQATFQKLIATGQVDGILSSLPVNTATEQLYEFSSPYFVIGTVVVVPSSSPYKSSNDLHMAEIGFDRTDGSEIVVGAKPTWILHPYDSATAALDDAVAGKLDGVILNFLNASRLTRSLYRTKVRILSPPLVTQNVRLAVRCGKNHELIELFNEGVRKFIANGKYKDILRYWGIEGTLPENTP